jgi:hypothetical protein
MQFNNGADCNAVGATPTGAQFMLTLLHVCVLLLRRAGMILRAVKSLEVALALWLQPAGCLRGARDLKP